MAAPTGSPTLSPTSIAATPTSTLTAGVATPTPVVASAAPQPAPGAARPGSPTPPKPGTYRYRETDENGTSTSTTEIVDRGGGRQTEESDEGITDDVEWRSNGKFLIATTFAAPGQSFRCDWNPDLLEYEFPLAAGGTWAFKGSCSPGPGVTLELSGTSRVMGAERVTVAGQQVDVWRIQSDLTITFKSPQGSGTQRVQADDRFSPRYGLTVKETDKTSGTDPSTGETSSETTTRELLNLSPASA